MQWTTLSIALILFVGLVWLGIPFCDWICRNNPIDKTKSHLFYFISIAAAAATVATSFYKNRINRDYMSIFVREQRKKRKKSKYAKPVCSFSWKLRTNQCTTIGYFDSCLCNFYWKSSWFIAQSVFDYTYFTATNKPIISACSPLIYNIHAFPLVCIMTIKM